MYEKMTKVWKNDEGMKKWRRYEKMTKVWKNEEVIKKGQTHLSEVLLVLLKKEAERTSVDRNKISSSRSVYRNKISSSSKGIKVRRHYPLYEANGTLWFKITTIMSSTPRNFNLYSRHSTSSCQEYEISSKRADVI